VNEEPEKQTTPLDIVYAQAVRAAQEFGWPVPARAEFEVRYREELSAHGPRETE